MTLKYVNRAESGLGAELAHMRKEIVFSLSLFSGLVGFIWLLWVLRPYSSSPSAHWLSILLLLSSAALAYLLLNTYPTRAAYVLLLGTTGTVILAVYVSSMSVLIGLLALPILIASVLLEERAFLGFVCLVVLCAVWLTGAAFVPLIVIAIIIIVTWLSTHNLYSTLEVVWTGYDLARHGERFVQERQAELRRVLKQLDEKRGV